MHTKRPGASSSLAGAFFCMTIFYIRLNAATKKKRTTVSTVPRDSVVETYSPSSFISAYSGIMNGAGSVYCSISASMSILSYGMMANSTEDTRPITPTITARRRPMVVSTGRMSFLLTLS